MLWSGCVPSDLPVDEESLASAPASERLSALRQAGGGAEPQLMLAHARGAADRAAVELWCASLLGPLPATLLCCQPKGPSPCRAGQGKAWCCAACVSLAPHKWD